MSEQKKADRYWMFAIVAFLAIVAWNAAQPLLACPACKDAVEQASNDGTIAAGSSDSSGPLGPNGLAKGFFWSILTMLGVVYTLLGVGVFFIVRSIRKARLGAQSVAHVSGDLVSES